MPFKFFGPGKPGVHAFTLRHNGIARFIQSPVFVSEAFDPRTISNLPKALKYNALWDTGATGSVISQKVVDDLGLDVIRTTIVSGVHGHEESNVYLVNIMMPNNVVVPGVAVTKGDLGGNDVLIGMDIIKEGDLALTNYKGKTVFTFRVPSQEGIDFTKEINEEKVRYEAHTSPEGQRRERKRKKQGMRKRKK